MEPGAVWPIRWNDRPPLYSWGQAEETVTLFGGVSRAETAGDAAKWGNILEGSGNFEIIRVELPKSAADSLMRFQKLDSIGPARYGELNQINVPGLRLVEQ